MKKSTYTDTIKCQYRDIHMNGIHRTLGGHGRNEPWPKHALEYQCRSRWRRTIDG